MIKLSTQFKHEMAKSFAHAILTKSGYNLVPCSMERHIREVIELDHASYKSINMPPVLRRLPDYFVMNRESMTRELVDIAYRTVIDDKLKMGLEKKLEVLKEMVLILFYGGSKNLGANQDLFEIVRCCRLEWHGLEPIIKLRTTMASPTEAVSLRSVPVNVIWDGMLPLKSVFGEVDDIDPSLEAAVETAARAFAA